MAERATKTIDEQFHDVSIAVAESRDFTNFCFTRLESRIGRLEQAMEGRFTGMEGRFTGMERRLTRHELLLAEILNEVKTASQ